MPDEADRSVAPERQSVPSLAERVVAELRVAPGRKASEIARALRVERRDVNRCLSHDLAGKVAQDATYRWKLREASAEALGRSTPPEPPTELNRLCRYFLECAGHNSDKGVSTFSSSRNGDPDYAEIPALPMLGAAGDWWNAPGVGRVLGKVSADKANLQAWIGYPVRLRYHQTPKWRGFFVEPVMLWSVTLPENPGDPYGLAEDLPVPNFAVLRSFAMGDAMAVVEEAARLDEELGLNAPIEDRPDVDELLERLGAIRPDWDWREPVNPYVCSEGPRLADLNEPGIYNRAVIIPGERSPYTRGLEAELKSLGSTPEQKLSGTALGRWLSGGTTPDPRSDNQPLIEVLPMNSEQRDAVRSALTSTHTVVTGPPGTGKSQVVTNLLVNAAWRGMKVLFASKNNKAVDVVEARVNGLGNRPVLLRLGSREYQVKLAEYMTAMLSGRIGEDDRVSYEEGLSAHHHLCERFSALEGLQKKTIDARNHADRVETEVEAFREVFGLQRFSELNPELVRRAAELMPRVEAAVDRVDPAKQGVFGRIGLSLSRAGRVSTLQELIGELKSYAAHVGSSAIPERLDQDLTATREWLVQLQARLAGAIKVQAYQTALETLRSSPSFEEIAGQRHELAAEVASNSERLWRDWVQLAPSRLTPEQRKDVADFAALLQVIIGQDGDRVNSTVRKKERALREKISALFSCWAVTALSARGKVPFVPGYFDLLVIDEASQCDIASALPLLFRAKRTVIIGDPKQLRHISAVPRSKDADLQAKYGLVENRAAWMYSVNSLYDLAAAVAGAEQIVNLRDHHRSHADIIDFSNRMFYEGTLRVATRYSHLKRPRGVKPGVVWQDAKGRVTRSGGSSAQNKPEAEALIGALRDLLIERRYEGTVGVVTPFRAQAQVIRDLLSADGALSDLGARRELLVDTVHRFQGDERDVMFFSPVVSDGVPPSALGFLRNNGNLFNVAITRARGLLQVVGDRAAAQESGVDYLAEFAVYAGRLVTEEARVLEEAQVREFGPLYPAVSRPERVSEWERVFYRALYEAGIQAIPQYTVEQYDLDFAVIVGGRRLNLEVDGERYHRSWTGELCLRDQLRNQRLIELGWEVKRFWVYEIRDRLPECVQWIRDWVERT
jgi:very-short-patch-repair endonuclease